MEAIGFSARGVTALRTVPSGRTITAKYYQNQILPVYFDTLTYRKVFPNERKIKFMQDGAPAHTEKHQ